MFEIGVIILFILLGYFVGSYKEKKHFESIIKREQQSIHLPVSNGKYPILPLTQNTDTELALGSVVISVDYF